MQLTKAAAVAVFFVGATGLAVPPAWAQDEEISASSGEAADDPDAAEKAAPVAEAAGEGGRLQAVVRGFFVEAHVGAGYMLLSATVPEPSDGQFWASGSENLGVGGVVGLAMGYDITEMIAIQALGGAVMVDGTRTDLVRDVTLIYGMAGARIAIDITDRLDLILAPSVGVAAGDNLIEESEVGFGWMLQTGIEYYVHVRHFSFGIELTTFMPILAEPRLFLALTPTLKYTF